MIQCEFELFDLFCIKLPILEIRTEARMILSYLLSALFRYRQETLRER
jgi:hypothetical protein